MISLPPYPVTVVGSWPRPPDLARAIRRRRNGAITAAEFDSLADRAARTAIEHQLDAGLDIVTDGEQRRDSFFAFVAQKLDGVRLFTLAEMLEVVDDRAGFEKILQTLDVPAFAITHPTCVGKVRRRAPLALDELSFVQSVTDKPVKVALPGPYLLTRAMWVSNLSRDAYPNKEALAEDVVRLLREEIEELVAAGVAFIQLDEPVLTELVFTQGQTRTFMCAALSARRDPAEELELAVRLINEVASAAAGARIGVHVCRGNWSRDETTLLKGHYDPLVPYLDRLEVDQLVLEYATPRAGSVVPVKTPELGLGVVNPRSDAIETAAAICDRVREAETATGARIFLNPDCGFGTFSARPMNSTAVASAKLQAMAEAARMLRAMKGRESD